MNLSLSIYQPNGKKYLEDALDAGLESSADHLARLEMTDTENPSQDLRTVGKWKVGPMPVVHFKWTHIGDRPSKPAVRRNGSGVELHRH